MTKPSVEERLQALEAKEEIRELFNRYGFSADSGVAQAWSEVWAADAVYERADGSIEGRAAFFDSIENPDGVHKRLIEGPGSLHTTGPLTIAVDGDAAWAEGPALVWVRKEDGYVVFSLSYNHWDLRKQDGRWEIVRRIGRPVGPGNAAATYRSWRA
jgi:hypothetical protein